MQGPEQTPWRDAASVIRMPFRARASEPDMPAGDQRLHDAAELGWRERRFGLCGT
jgi:hypothetical protein